MKGWKTWIAGLGAIATGIGEIVAGLISDPFDSQKIVEGFTIISGGFAVIGIGHKIEKSLK